MDMSQLPGDNRSKLGEKLRRITQLPITMVFVVASFVASILAIVMLIKFLEYGLKTFGIEILVHK